MGKFSQSSLDKLNTCAIPLRVLFNEVVQDFDCTVLEGKRSIEQQKENVAKGVSKTMDSRHLDEPLANAVDVAPYPLQWPRKPKSDSPAELKRWMKDYARFYYFAGYVIATAKHLGVSVRFGGDWDGDFDIQEESFDDLVHWELRKD
jgi:peptidoglycan L-alanyl-D-glutamate endopeptidase CwlK